MSAVMAVREVLAFAQVVVVSVALGGALFVACWVVVATLGCREHGWRFFTVRRWKAVRSCYAECVGGPFDGMLLPITRRALLGWTVADWPDVLYDATTQRYRAVPEGTMRLTFDGRSVWAGYYLFRHCADHYDFQGTGSERYADMLFRESQVQP